MYPRPRSWSETWPLLLLDLEPLDLLLDAVGDELLDAAVAGGLRRALGPVVEAVFDLDLGHRRPPPDVEAFHSAGKDVLADHRGGVGQAELGEDRRGDVDERRRLAAERAVAEQHAGHLERVGAVVGAPGRVVVEQDLVGQVAQAGRPRGPVAAVVADDQVGRQAGRVALSRSGPSGRRRGSPAGRRRR